MDPDNQAPAATAPTQDELSWADIEKDFLEEKGIEPGKPEEDSADEPTDKPKNEEGPQGGEEEEENPQDKKPDEEQGDGDDSKKKTEGDPEAPENPEQPVEPPSIRDQLREERELKQARADIETDVRSKLFSDRPTRLEDADGEPIETVADVMKLKNPRTGKAFTADEAASWLMQAQGHLEKNMKADQAEIDKVVETNLALKYDLEAVKSEYGELLRHMPNLRRKVSEAFLRQVDLGSDGETITGTKLGMKEFYDIMLAPYMKQVEQMKKEAAEKEQAEKAAAAEKLKKEQEAKRQNDRSDREDITSTRTKVEDIEDDEERKWAQTAKEYYEGK